MSNLANSTDTFVRNTHELNWALLICGQCGVPACAYGDPGVGKTETLRALAEATSRLFYSYELSRCQPEDLQGFPIVDEYLHLGEKYKYMRFVPDERLLKCELEASLLLMDEITNVVAAKQAPALNLVSRGLNNCWMYMACNPIENAADGQPLTPPFINRIWYGPWEVDEEAQDWGLTHMLQYPEPEIPLVPADYMKFQPKWGNLVKDYFSYNPKDRNACPKKEEAKHKPWPSSRTWNHVTRCLAGVDAVGASDAVRDDVIKGLVGETAGVSFIKWIEQLKLPKPEDILADAGSFSMPKRYDIAKAILEGVVNYLSRNQTEENFIRAHKLQNTIYKQSSEMGVAFLGGIRIAMPAFTHEADKKRILAVK